MTFAVAVVGTLLLAAVALAGSPRGRPAPWPAVAPSRSWRSCRSRSRCPPTAGPVSVGFVQGNVPQAGLEFNAERRAVLDNHVRGTEELARGRPERPQPSSCGPRTPPTSTRSATPTPRPRSTGPRRPSACPCSSGRCSPSRPGPAQRLAVLRPGRGRAAAATPSCTRCPSPSTSRTAPSSGCSRRWPTWPGTSSPAPEIGVFRVEAPGGDYVALPTICFEVAYDGLHARQRPRRRRRGEPARRSDEQRDLRPHRRVRAAVRHLADPGHRARPVGRPRVDRRGVGVHRARRNGVRQDRPVHGRAGPRSTRRALERTPSTASARHRSGSPRGPCSCWCSGASGSSRRVRVLAPSDRPDEDGPSA